MPAKQAKPLTVDELMAKGHLVKGDHESLRVERIPIGIPQLDEILNGGLPRRRISIFTGQYSGGKTLVAQLAMKQALALGLSVAYIDTEQTYEPVWWGQVGLPLDQIYVSQPATGEEAVDIVMALVGAKVDMVVVDSLAALVPSAEAEAEAKQRFIGLQAQLVNRFMRKLLAAKHNSVVVCTNQLRDSIGPGPADPMPGGVGQGFFTSLIIRFQREGWIDGANGERVGFNMRLICRKSKVGRPFGECLLPFHFRGEIDMMSLLLDQALEAGLARQVGPWYHLSFGGKELKQQGRNAVLTALADDAALHELLRQALGYPPAVAGGNDG